MQIKEIEKGWHNLSCHGLCQMQTLCTCCQSKEMPVPKVIIGHFPGGIKGSPELTRALH